MKLPLLTALLCLFSSESVAQLLNGGFENLDNKGVPKYWTMKSYSHFVLMDSNGFNLYDSVVFDKTNYTSNNAFSGFNALELRNAYNFTKQIGMPGVAFASPDSSRIKGVGNQMIAIADQPLSLTFYGAFNQVGGDVAYARIKVYDSDLKEIGDGECLLDISFETYTLFDVPVNYTSSAQAAFVSIEFGTAKDGAGAHLGSVLRIDEVNLSYATSMDTPESGDLITFFPNPASTSFAVNTKKVPMGKGLVLVDMTGKAIHIFASSEGVYLVDNLREGVYVVIVPGTNSNFKYKLVVKR